MLKKQSRTPKNQVNTIDFREYIDRLEQDRRETERRLMDDAREREQRSQEREQRSREDRMELEERSLALEQRSFALEQRSREERKELEQRLGTKIDKLVTTHLWFMGINMAALIGAITITIAFINMLVNGNGM